MVNAKYRFRQVHIGEYGRSSNRSFASNAWPMAEPAKMLEVPDDQQLPGAEHLGNMKLNGFFCVYPWEGLNMLFIHFYLKTIRSKQIIRKYRDHVSIFYRIKSISESDFLNVSHSFSMWAGGELWQVVMSGLGTNRSFEPVVPVYQIGLNRSKQFTSWVRADPQYSKVTPFRTSLIVNPE